MRPIARPARISQIAHANLLVPPEPAQQVTFTKGFGPRSLLTVDTEEEFDWNAPFRADGYGLDHVRAISGFQEFCEGLQVTPVYLVDWPIANDPLARDIIGDAVRAGKAEIGVQLHPWVNPPFSEEVSTHNSYAGNLPPDLEEAKYRKLRDKIEESFGTLPRIYRAGLSQYDLGRGAADPDLGLDRVVALGPRERFLGNGKGGDGAGRCLQGRQHPRNDAGIDQWPGGIVDQHR